MGKKIKIEIGYVFYLYSRIFNYLITLDLSGIRMIRIIN